MFFGHVTRQQFDITAFGQKSINAALKSWTATFHFMKSATVNSLQKDYFFSEKKFFGCSVNYLSNYDKLRQNYLCGHIVFGLSENNCFV